MEAEIYYLRYQRHPNAKEYERNISEKKSYPTLKEVKEYYEKVGEIKNVDKLKEVHRLCKRKYAPQTSYIHITNERSIRTGDLISFEGKTTYIVKNDEFEKISSLNNLSERLEKL